MNTTLAPAGEAGAANGLAAWIAPSRTALVVIDMQVDFASPEGVLGGFGVDLSTVGPALAAAQALVEAARSAGVTVIFVGLQTSAEQDSAAWRERMRRQGGDAEQDSALCRVGTPGAAFVGPEPLAGELVISKTRYSGFFRTDLDAELRKRGLDTIVACGLTTECCVDCTVRDAFHLDYHVFVPRDACAAYEPDLHEGALKSLELNCAILVDTAQVLTAWAEAA
jgi:ureidoacrylate peracid hydrolase